MGRKKKISRSITTVFCHTSSFVKWKQLCYTQWRKGYGGCDWLNNSKKWLVQLGLSARKARRKQSRAPKLIWVERYTTVRLWLVRAEQNGYLLTICQLKCYSNHSTLHRPFSFVARSPHSSRTPSSLQNPRTNKYPDERRRSHGRVEMENDFNSNDNNWGAAEEKKTS